MLDFTDFEPEFSSSIWRFGASDPQRSSSYVWLDGNLRAGSYYRQDYPASDYNDCLYLYRDTWMDGLCTDIATFICEKDQGKKYPTIQCIEFILKIVW